MVRVTRSHKVYCSNRSSISCPIIQVGGVRLIAASKYNGQKWHQKVSCPLNVCRGSDKFITHGPVHHRFDQHQEQVRHSRFGTHKVKASSRQHKYKYYKDKIRLSRHRVHTFEQGPGSNDTRRNSAMESVGVLNRQGTHRGWIGISGPTYNRCDQHHTSMRHSRFGKRKVKAPPQRYTYKYNKRKSRLSQRGFRMFRQEPVSNDTNRNARMESVGVHNKHFSGEGQIGLTECNVEMNHVGQGCGKTQVGIVGIESSGEGLSDEEDMLVHEMDKWIASVVGAEYDNKVDDSDLRDCAPKAYPMCASADDGQVMDGDSWNLSEPGIYVQQSLLYCNDGGIALDT